MSKIFSHAPATPVATASAPAAAAPASAAPTPAPSPAAAAPVPPATAAAPAPPKVVDVTAILDGLAAKNAEKLDWKKSIVDLMKLVGMDSSFGARKELAKELNYAGDPNDSATMNIWLHKQVLIKLSENGGKVPAELLD
jgi:3-oxoacyl-ACP reductase-like protein